MYVYKNIYNGLTIRGAGTADWTRKQPLSEVSALPSQICLNIITREKEQMKHSNRLLLGLLVLCTTYLKKKCLDLFPVKKQFLRIAPISFREFELDLSQLFAEGTLNKYPLTQIAGVEVRCYHDDLFYSLTIIFSPLFNF